MTQSNFPIRVETGDRPSETGSGLTPIVIVLDHLRSAYNVGNIFRLAEIADVREIITCGYTATPPHPKLQKTARGCDQLVHCRHVEDPTVALSELKSDGYRVIGVETVADAPLLWDAPMGFPVAFVFGNEALGIQPATLDACDGFLRLPVAGVKNSMNVSNCAAAVIHEALRRLRERA